MYVLDISSYMCIIFLLHVFINIYIHVPGIYIYTCIRVRVLLFVVIVMFCHRSSRSTHRTNNVKGQVEVVDTVVLVVCSVSY